MSTDLREIIDSRTASGISPGTIPDTLEYVEQQALIRAALSFAEGGSIEVAEAVSVATLLSGVIGYIVILLLLLSLIMLVAWLVNLLATVFSRIPLAGAPVARYIRVSFSWETFLSGWINRQLDPLVTNLWSDLITIVGAFASWAFTRPTSAPKGVTSAQVHQLQLEINATNARVDTLNHALVQLSQYVHNEPAPTTTVNVITLPDQLHKVQADLHTLYQNQSQFYTELQHVVSNLTQLDNDVKQLEKALIGTRTEQLGVQDTLRSMNDTITETKALESHLSGQVQQNTRSIAVLNPLSILLEPGMPGLNNLRKLEDDPCQCPKLGNIPNELGTALALLEFVENG